ncbi:polysaccharide deacetylase family protein [Rhodocytophaga rosea]|uniref:Polysaccharide deacetylase family protein n=1 Tax=Rhodocytophaga rosea TaxID=2704465 RepID=A0A6C0GD99_9BACT|nr:polysaccharide deacetylase family protein [Rhodocytophaga rosea]QHT65783.1 polysaccharide deacetylase family protein [Rhodocytophaga rosea]
MNVLVEQLHSKSLKPFIVISFDDGYVDNYLEAKPLLEKYELPATFFISNKHIGTTKAFWWDELAYLLLQVKSLPATLSIHLNKELIIYNLKDDAVLTEEKFQKHRLWNYTLTPPTRRAALYISLWKLLSPLPYEEQQDFLEELKRWAGTQQQIDANYFSMSERQLTDLADCELFTVGGHTVSHLALSHHAVEIQHQEIAHNKQYLEAATGEEIDTFAYPSGNFNETTVNILKQQGFRSAFTTHHQSVQSQTDPFRVGRFQIGNWSGKKFNQMLSQFSHN